MRFRPSSTLYIGKATIRFFIVSKMNRPAIVVALVLVCTFSSNAEKSPDFKAAIDECKNQHNIESSQIKEAVEQKKLPETEDGQCFMACVMEKMGLLKDGKVDMDKTLEMNKQKFKNPEDLEKANEIARRCANVQATDSKPCSFATEVTKCVIKNATELKLDMPKEEA